ncbi:heavy metal sensor histidine kinase [Silvanigrella aquatica]|uniref:histidine kinase n=1 Tax=Silvanigrella aquatica TaxID=1915309 RepID=A0A1L4CZQ2_9BACT|nr:heavy metal sensor histidine kinase [Silvanigrella aquatica]APJ03418.1 hypothetical protein AXG55_05665 [Silvanigrella aquatica]
MNKLSLFLIRIRKKNFNISLSIWLSFWYFITCIILISSQNFLFNNFVSSFYSQTENLTLDKSIHDIVRLIDKKENHDKTPYKFLLFDDYESFFYLVEDLTNKKIIFISPGMFKFLYSLREYSNEKLPEPSDDINIMKKNSKYFYFVKKELIHNNKLIHIEILADKTNKISLLTKFKNTSSLISYSILFSCLILSVFISRIILSPIHRIMKKIRSINSSNLHERVDINWIPQEVKIIKNSFNEVLERLEDSFARISQFSDDIAHEIRTPLNNLKGEIEVALQNKRTEQEYIDILYSNLEECHRLTKIIDNLMFLSRSEKNNMHINVEEVNIYQELLNLKDLYDGIADEKFISINIFCDIDLTHTLDRVLFQRIISNLLSNAITYNKENGKIDIYAKLNETNLSIEVSDTGIGIAQKDLPHLFDRFYRIDKSRYTPSKNLGLGLSMVKSMIGLHKGTIEIKSKEGQGTSVFVVFPNKTVTSLKLN